MDPVEGVGNCQLGGLSMILVIIGALVVLTVSLLIIALLIQGVTSTEYEGNGPFDGGKVYR
jgi:hypothetical protein